MHKLSALVLIAVTFFISTKISGQDSLENKTNAQYPALLWKITGNGLTKPSYLYGMLETNQKLAYHLIDSFYIALRQVDRILLELHPDSVAKSMRDPAILKRVYKDEYNTGYDPSGQYYKILEPETMDEDMFEYILSGFSSYGYFDMESDMSEEKSLPDFVFMAALKLNKEISGLISFGEQLDQVDKSRKFYKEDQKKPSNEREDYSEYQVLMQKAFEAYRKGDLALLDSLYRKMVNKPEYFIQILEPFYQFYGERLTGQLKESSSLFAVMDVLALPGRKGVIEYLRSQGFTVSPVAHYIITKPNRQKEKLEKMTRRTKLTEYKSVSGFWSVRVPDHTTGAADERGGMTEFSDNLNDANYSVSRYPTHAQLSFRTPESLLEQMDSVIYEYVPGKIIRRNDITISGFPGVEITNKASNGDLEMFKLVITPLEVIVFKVTGRKSYIRKHQVGKKFIASSRVFPASQSEWTKVTTGHGEFSLSLPSYYTVDTASNPVFADPEIEYQAWDPETASYFLFRRNIHHDLEYLEEDTFDLNFMAEEIARSMKREVETDPPSLYQGYPSVNFRMWTIDKSDTLVNKIVLRGASHYLLTVQTLQPALAEKFFRGFNMIPFNYILKGDTVVDSTLAYTVVSDVLKQENDENDDDSYSYSYLPDPEKKKREKSHLPALKYASYYFDQGSEYIEVERYKNHDYKGFLSYKALWDDLKEEASNDSDMVVKVLGSDSTAGFPWLEISLTDTNSIRQIYQKFIIHHGATYTLSSMSDTLSGMPLFTKNFYSSFTPIKDSLVGRSLFEDKGFLFIRNFLSEDTLIVKQAIESVDMITFRKHHRDSLWYLMGQTKLMKRNLAVASALITAVGKLKVKGDYAKLEALYGQYEGNPSIQLDIFSAIAIQEEPEAMKALLRILVIDPPLPSSDYAIGASVKTNQIPVNQFTKLFPDIMAYDRYPEYARWVYSLLLSQIEKEKFSLESYPNIANNLKDRANEELKRRKEANQVDKAASKDELEELDFEYYDAEEEYDYAEAVEVAMEAVEMDEMISVKDTAHSEDYSNLSELMLMMRALYKVEKVKNPTWLKDACEKIIAGKQKNDALEMAVFMLKQGEHVEDTLLKSFAKEPEIRISFYRRLKEDSLLQYFDTTYLHQISFAESFMCLRADIEDEDSLTFLEKRFITTPRKSGYVYVFKYKSGYGKDKDWVLGFAGIQPADTLSVSDVSDFVKDDVDQIYEGDDLKEIIDKNMKSLRKLYRKRFSSYNDYDYDDYEFEEELYDY